MKEKISVIGLGYIGLPTSVLFAKSGYEVLGYDSNTEIVDALNKGKVMIKEPFLEEELAEVIEAKAFKAYTELQEAQIYIICVPTPLTDEKKADMSFVRQAAEAVASLLKAGDTVILESTSPPGTTEELIGPILSKGGLKAGEDFFLGHSPERVLPGCMLKEIVENDRIVGGVKPASADRIRSIYESFVKGEIHKTDARTAELSKLVENTYRDVNIALANELAILCEDEGIDVFEVVELANNHPRVHVHMPGPGVGGHCIAIDPWFIIEKQKKSSVILASRQVNDHMPAYTFKKAKSLLALSENNKAKIAILGCSYKPNVDDLRESPVLELVDLLEKEGNIEIALFDPYVIDKEFPQKKYLTENVEEAFEDANLLVLAVHHEVFKELDLESLKDLMSEAIFLDTRNFFERKLLEEMGYEYYKLGCGA